MTKVIITRPLDFANELKEELSKHNIDSLVFPTIDIEPIHMDVTISFIDYYLFVSRNAVLHGAALMPPGSKTLAIGKGTYDALVKEGFTPSVMPEKPYTSEQFLAIDNLPLTKNDHIAIMKGVGGRELLASQIRHQVASVSTISVYERHKAEPEKSSVKTYQKTLAKNCEAIFVNSIDSLNNLIELTPEDSLDSLKNQQLITGSGRIAEAIKAAQFVKPVWLAESTTDSDMIQCLLNKR